MNGQATGARRRAGLVGTLVVLAVYGGLALAVDPVEARRTAVNPAAVPGFQSDEATYYLMGQSLASDGDLEYRREDLERARREFAPGPNGVFLKRGVDVTGVAFVAAPPFVSLSGVPDPDAGRLYYGKSFIYPLVAAPFVKIFGTRGFYVTNALLLSLGFLGSYLFFSARSGILAGLLLSGAFIFATVVPVYYAWIAPELFNCAIGIVAYVCWLYKEVAPAASSRLGAWLRRPSSDFVASALTGVLTFSKVSNALLVAPLVLWFAWKRQWLRAVNVAMVWFVVTAALFGANVGITGEWNYQGGIDRRTCYERPGRPFPLSSDEVGLEVCDERGRSQALGGVIFDREVFWSNLRANLVYFVVGRNSGVAVYFFPAVLGVLAMCLTRRRREAWQWCVLAGILAQALLFIVSQPYSYFGGGGSVGNRYFMGAYGMAVFLFPPVRSKALWVLPWIVGTVFMTPLVVSPFDTSIRPGDHAKHGPLRVLPVELTNVNDLPINTEGSAIKDWYGDDGTHPGFQIYRLDDNSYLREADRLSFWTRGDSRAQMLVKADRPYDRIRFRLEAGPVTPTTVVVDVNGRRAAVVLAAGQSQWLQCAMGPGFPYKKDRAEPAYVWVVTIHTGAGFRPADTGSPDLRFLGARVMPTIIR